MNDTEEVARRLFATAAADIPPGIDLLHGVRTRRRSRQIRTRAVACAGAAVVLAATPATLLMSQAPSALAQVTLAAARTAAQSYRVTSTASVAAAPEGPGPVQATVSGEFDPARGTGVETTTQGDQIRYLDGYMYLPMPDAYRYAYQAARKVPVPAGKTWLRLKVLHPQDPGSAQAQLLLSIGGLTTLELDNPQSLLALIKSATQVREVGPASGPGWTGTRYAISATANPGSTPHAVQRISGTVDVDQQGRVRRLDTRMSATSRDQSSAGPEMVRQVTMTFGDFGIPVPSVSAPPASETFAPAGGAAGLVAGPTWVARTPEAG